MRHTKIQWCDSTVNPVMGCDGCELWIVIQGVRICYAGRMHATRGSTNPGFAKNFDQPQMFPGRMAEAAAWSDLSGQDRADEPWLNGMPRLIFVSDMGDALSNGIPFEYLKAEIIDIASTRRGRRHIWQWLTKQPGRMAEFSAWLSELGVPWPDNVWVGTSVTTTATLNRVKALLRVGSETTVRFLSVEPQWEDIDLTEWLPKVDWIIQGGQSGAEARPFDLAWARSMRDAARRAGVPYFLKQLGAHAIENGHRLRLQDHHGGDWSEWPEDLRVREVPRATAVAHTRSSGLDERLPSIELPGAASPEPPRRHLPVLQTINGTSSSPPAQATLPSPDPAPVASPDGNTVSIGVGEGEPEIPPAIPDEVVGRLAAALAEQRNLTETLRAFADELGKLIDEDTNAVEQFKAGMIAAGVGYVRAYHVRGLRLLAAKRALEAQAKDDDDRRDAIIGTWEDEQARRQGVTPRTIRQWIHEAESPSEWWQALLAETERHVKATVPRPPPSISRFFKALEKETRREPEEDPEGDDLGPSILDDPPPRSSVDGNPESEHEEDDDPEEHDHPEDVTPSAEAQTIRNLVFALLSREMRALDLAMEAVGARADDEAVREDIARLKTEIPNVADYVHAMDESARLKEENEKLRDELARLHAKQVPSSPVPSEPATEEEIRQRINELQARHDALPDKIKGKANPHRTRLNNEISVLERRLMAPGMDMFNKQPAPDDDE